ncbi:GntR family transcriptional regulator [Modestobacter italicus]|uniref:GntR family transcriptional regulator n=1 Tax=Modestobacter italicus (strain DSM 44449 / CECT 9708 / BC 501) TaxID=2732864 RepID=UPI001C980762|nr:GntR family transcriptional regulator [Modestobacter italicus]
MADEGAAALIVDGVVPKHEQLRARLSELAARLPAGAPLPGERQLCIEHGVSRITVREAIGQLVSEGVLVRVRGKGTFVAERAARSRLHLASFHSDMRRLGLRPGTVVLAVDRAVPPPATREALELAAGERAWHVRRLRLADDQPMSVDDGWYPVAVLPDLADADLTGSLYTLLAERYGCTIDRAEQTVRAAEVDRGTAVLLGLSASRPVLVFDRVSYSAGRPVEHARSTYRGDRYEVAMTVELGQG